MLFWHLWVFGFQLDTVSNMCWSIYLLFQFSLAQLYHNGTGMKKDLKMALSLYEVKLKKKLFLNFQTIHCHSNTHVKRIRFIKFRHRKNLLFWAMFLAIIIGMLCRQTVNCKAPLHALLIHGKGIMDYSRTLLICSPMGNKNLVILMEWPYWRGYLDKKKMNGWALIRARIKWL